jgi:hypothetical protein
MFKTVFIALLPILVFFGESSSSLFSRIGLTSSRGDSGTLEKLVAESGTISIGLNLDRVNGTNDKSAHLTELQFDVAANSFFSAMAYNGELRGTLPSSLGIVPRASSFLPARLSASYNTLVIESLPWGGNYDLVVRDAETGYIFFNVEGYEMSYDSAGRVLGFKGGRMLLSNEFANDLGRPGDAGVIVGELNVAANMKPIEITQVVNGEVGSAVLPAGAGMRPDAGSVPGPDVIVGDVNGLAQFGTASNGFVGLAVGTDSCNAGTVDLHWDALPSNDHPVIPQNMYRMSGGPNNDQTFEQIGQSSVKHGFTALAQNICGFGCNGVNGTRLGSGCSDPYVASLNAGPQLGSRAWVNPFTGFFPRSDTSTPPNNHSSHTHTGPSHRMLTQIADLDTAQNAGATYYAEGQYVTPHEFVWCQANPTQCNMNNNVSYRRYNVFGTASPFSFSPVGATVRQKPAVAAWTGATIEQIEPEPGLDGVGSVAFKVTNPSPGVWHYEYAIYNQNLDRSIRSFTIPVPAGTVISDVGFHAPPQHPGWAADGTMGNAGYSSAPWVFSQTADSVTWSTETMAANPNANAIRWGTLYNFRFDANAPPSVVSSTIGYFKTGAPSGVRIQGPAGAPMSVTGRVFTPTGQALRNVKVVLTDGQGVRRTATTSSFGVYTFDNLDSGQSYTATVVAKRYRFAPRNVSGGGNLTDFDFFGLE